jgi:hypothetical protein
MLKKIQTFSNFSRTFNTRSNTYRPEHEHQLPSIFLQTPDDSLLARGNGLSYSDCCVNHQKTVIDTSRLNHLLSFDPQSGLLICQAGVIFSDLFLVDQDFIPPVLPGTMHATLAGGIANDVHGKNNPHKGSIGQHIAWLDLQLGEQSLRCSESEHPELFKASIAGLGLTGVIKRIAIRLQKASHWVAKTTQPFTDVPSLLKHMQEEGMHHDYQVAWLDLLAKKPRALLSTANHITPSARRITPTKKQVHYTIPKLPLRLIHRASIQGFNRIYYHHAPTTSAIMPLWQFNNPLDQLKNWNRLYGSRGLIQFQAVFDANYAEQTLQTLLTIIHAQGAIPTLAVLKYFTQSGTGLLSFAQPGFSIAIDFIHTPKARQAIASMNQLMADSGGKIYLAKDLLLTRDQFNIMYPNHERFCDILEKYQSPMHSDLAKRLGIRRASS